jgi:hypothetical protein
MPRVGHLRAVYHIFAYLKHHENCNIVFDPNRPDVDDRLFPTADWSDFYGDVSEEIPPHMPQPLGESVRITCFVDAAHAGDPITRRSHTGILIYLNKAPIVWYSKKQSTVESSTFGSEFVAEMIESLRYKLRMFGIPIDGPCDIYCDNQSVVSNSTVPESVLQKKHLSICYHRVREAHAREILRMAKIDGKSNLADLFTKILPTPVRRTLLRDITY